MKIFARCFTLILIFAIMTHCMAIEANATCSTEEDCPDLYQCNNNICVHKPLFPITFREVGGTVFILVLNAIMTAGGVGAGAAYVPYIILIFQYTLKKSIYIAYACVFGGGLGNLANIIWLKNPKTNRYIINYDVNLVILPALMIGVLIGVLLSRIFAPFITNLILLFVLGYSIFKNFFKLKINLAKERKERAAKKQAVAEQVTIKAEAVSSEPIQGRQIQEEGSEKTGQEALDKLSKVPSELPPFDKISSSSTNSTSKENEAESSENSIVKSKAEKRAVLMRKEQRFPFHKIGILFISVIITVVVGIIRGSKRFEPVVGVQWSCGWDFIWLGIAIFAFLLNSALNVYLVKKWQREKLEVDYEFLPEEPLLTRDRTIKLTVGSTVAGIIGALVALGGALIIGPILLGMHMPPAFSAATTGVFMVFSMFNAMFSTILDGQLSGQELAWFLPLAFVFSFISSKLVNWYVKKTGRQSTVILTVMTGVIMGFVCLLVIFIQANIENFKVQIKFNSLC